MDKILNSSWFAYLFSIVFIILGLCLLKLWRKSINPNALEWERIFTEWRYLAFGIFFFIVGIAFLIILIIQDCTGWVAK
jgi:hypothetical protein